MRAPCCFPSVIPGGLKCLLQCSQVQKIAKHCENSYRFNSQRSELTVLNVFNYSQLYILCNDLLKNGKKDIVAFLSNQGWMDVLCRLIRAGLSRWSPCFVFSCGFLRTSLSSQLPRLTGGTALGEAHRGPLCGPEGPLMLECFFFCSWVPLE